MKTLILCGGHGLRLRGNFSDTPKPLIQVGGKPILSFIVEMYASQGFDDIYLLVGHGESYFRSFAEGFNASGRVRITVLQTGLDTPTGGRLHYARKILLKDKSFMLTYGDGVADLNIPALVHHHTSAGRVATLTAVKPHLPFGLVDLDASSMVESFQEKPVMDSYISGGFFVFNYSVFDVLDEFTDLEGHVLPYLAQRKELSAYRHDGFWRSMDTYKDYVCLNQLDLPSLIKRG